MESNEDDPILRSYTRIAGERPNVQIIRSLLSGHEMSEIDELAMVDRGDEQQWTHATTGQLTQNDILAVIVGLPDEPRAHVGYNAPGAYCVDPWDVMNSRIQAAINRSYQRRQARNARARRTQRLVRRQRRAAQRKHERGKN